MSRVWLVTFLFSLSFYCVQSQNTKEYLSVNIKDWSLETILDTITYKTGYYFSYNADAIPPGSLYSLKRDSIGTEALIELLLVGTNLDYIMLDNQVIIRPIERDIDFESLKNQPTSTVKGWVHLEDDNEPIVGCSVYFNGTTLGAITDVNGNYVIKNVPAGVHQLIISHVGYEADAYQVRVRGGNTYVVNSLLKNAMVSLPALEVTSRPLIDSSMWRTHYRSFKREFIGFSTNADHCDILNAELLSFSYDKEMNKLYAYSDKPLMIENRSLGYMLTCDLVSYEQTHQLTQFHIRAQFKNIRPTSKREKKKWKRNRKATFRGSSQHFFQSLIRDEVRSEGFRMYLDKPTEFVEVKPIEIVRMSKDDLHYLLDFEGKLKVRYMKEASNNSYISFDRLNTVYGTVGHDMKTEQPYQESSLELLENEVILFSSGQIDDPEDIIRLGYWSWERLADLMPANYDPKNDNL